MKLVATYVCVTMSPTKAARRKFPVACHAPSASRDPSAGLEAEDAVDAPSLRRRERLTQPRGQGGGTIELRTSGGEVARRSRLPSSARGLAGPDASSSRRAIDASAAC